MQLAQLPSPAIDFGRITGGIPWTGEGKGLFAPEFANQGLGYLISSGVKFAIAIAGLLLLIYLIYGGFQLMTSAGDPAKMKSAKEILTRAVVGFVIIFIAYWVIQLVGIAFGITDIQQTFR